MKRPAPHDESPIYSTLNGDLLKVIGAYLTTAELLKARRASRVSKHSWSACIVTVHLRYPGTADYLKTFMRSTPGVRHVALHGRSALANFTNFLRSGCWTRIKTVRIGSTMKSSSDVPIGGRDVQELLARLQELQPDFCGLVIGYCSMDKAVTKSLCNGLFAKFARRLVSFEIRREHYAGLASSNAVLQPVAMRRLRVSVQAGCSASFITKCPALRELKICVETAEHVAQLTEYVRSSHLEKLDIHFMSSDSSPFFAMIHAGDAPHLKTLSVTDATIPDTDMSVCSGLRDIRFSVCTFAAADTTIGSCLRLPLETFGLHHCDGRVEDIVAGLAGLRGSACSQSLTRLHLCRVPGVEGYYTGIAGCAWMPLLLGAIPHLPRLTALDISHNRLCSEDVRTLGELTCVHSSLRRLLLHDTKQFNKEVIVCFCDMLRELKQPTEVGLDHNYIGHKLKASIGRGMPKPLFLVYGAYSIDKIW